MLAILARAYFDWSIGLHTVEVASLVQPLQPDCIRSVVDAFPENSETEALIANAADLCNARKEPDCSQISRRRR
jgi:hypothetical protein